MSFLRKTYSRKSFYLPQVQAWINQLSAPLPSASYLSAVNTLVSTMITDGNFYELDKFCIFATEQQQHARICLVNPTSTAITEVNSPTWTANQGYTGNGTTSYLNTNLLGGTETKFKQDNGSFGAYSRTNLDDGTVVLGNYATAGASQNFIIPRTAGSLSVRLNCTSSSTGVVADSLGMFSAVRTDSANISSWKRGVQISTTARASVTVPLFNWYVCAYNVAGVASGFTTRQLSCAFIGSGAINQLKLYNSVQTFLTTLGANV